MVDRLQPVRPALNTITFSLMANISTDVQEVAFAYISEPRENLSGNSNGTLLSTFLLPRCSSLKTLLSLRSKTSRRLDASQAHPFRLEHPWKDSYKKEEDGTKTKVDDHNLVVFKRKVERKMRGEIVRNNPPVIFDSLGQKVPNPPKLGSGSKVKVIYQPYAYDTAVKGVQFQLMGLQIVELKAAASEISVAPVEGGWQAEREGIDELQAILND